MSEKNNNLAAIVALIFAIIACTCSMYVLAENFFSSEKNNKVQTDTISEEYQTESVPTIQDILDFRVDILRGQYIDSIFLTMPEVVLVDILMQHGTTLSNQDIVTIYESNKETYNKVMSGARSQKIIDSLQENKLLKVKDPFEQKTDTALR